MSAAATVFVLPPAFTHAAVVRNDCNQHEWWLRGYSRSMSQFEQENDLGRGGGEVDDETAKDAWDTRLERSDDDRAPDELDEIEREGTTRDDV
jgi:hypothetical protein